MDKEVDVIDGERTNSDEGATGAANGGAALEPEAVVASVGAGMEGAVERFFGGLSAASVFGSPERVGERLVIPAASIQRAGGFGFGGGTGTDRKNDAPSSGGGGGGGGGGAAEGRPVAVVEIAPDGVHVRPVVDFTRIGVTLLLAAVAVWGFSTASGARPGRRSPGPRRRLGRRLPAVWA